MMCRIALLFSLLIGPIFSEPLTLTDCFSLALHYNPRQTSAYFHAKAAGFDACIEKSGFYPELYATAHGFKWQTHNFLQINAPPPVPPNILPSLIGPTEDYGYLISGRYTLFDFGEAKERYQAAIALYGAASFEKERIQEEILLNTALAFFELASKKELVLVAEKNLGRSEDHYVLVHDKREVGSAPLSDILRSKVDVAEARLTLSRAKAQVDISKASLREVLGFDYTCPLEIEAKTTEHKRPSECEIPRAQEMAFQNRPELKALCKTIKALFHKRESIKSTNWPKVSALGAYGRRDSDFLPHDEEWLFGVRMEMPLFTGFKISSQESKAQAEMNEARAEFEVARKRIDKEIMTAFAKLNEAYEFIRTTRIQVEDARESVRLTEERYKAGVSTLTDLLDAETSLVRAEATHVNAEWNFEAATSYFLWAQGLLSYSLDCN